MFEIVKRDGLARIGKFETKHGVLETPALLPVVNPKIFTVTPRELYDEFGFRALITNSYIIKNNENLRKKAQEVGLHEMLDFPGVIMTDSGTFQSHMYGTVPITNEEIIEFQKSIGTDIGTVLDVFTEPEWTKEETADSIKTTLKRTKEACGMKGEMMLNGVVQGSVYPDLREDCARKMAKMDIDVHPIGGVVPLMEQYRYAELVDVIISSKKGLNPSRPVHLFGAGHPMVIALAALLGCDLFDSASYAKYARDDRMMFIDGTSKLSDMISHDCNCPACKGHSLEDIRKMKKDERERLIARHNLYQITDEINLVKRYIREGRLWELVEIRCRSHPALLDAVRKLKVHTEFLEKYEPISRDGAMFYTGPETFARPVFRRYRERLMERYVAPTKKAALFPDSWKPYSRHFVSDFDKARKAGYTPVVLSPFGPVPAELDEVYPIAQSMFPDIPDGEMEKAYDEYVMEFLEKAGFEEAVEFDEEMDGKEEYDADYLRAIATARYQFGIKAANCLFKGKVEFVKSRKTEKIRNVISDGEHVLSMRAGDSLYTLKPEGAKRILKAVKGKFMRVVAMDDAVPFVSQGRNMFCQFVIDMDEKIRPMEEVIIVDSKDNFVATGRAILVKDEIKSFGKGIAVKVRTGNDDT